jgi:hypothetical protein
VQAQRAGVFFALAAKCLPVPALLSSSSWRYAAVAPALSTNTAAPTPTAAAGAAASSSTGSSSGNPADSSTAAAIAAAVAAVSDAPLTAAALLTQLHSPAAAANTGDTAATTAAATAAAAVAEGHWRCTVCARISAYPDWYDPAQGGRPELRMVVKQGEVDAKKLRAQFTPILSTPKVRVVATAIVHQAVSSVLTVCLLVEDSSVY